MTLEMTARQNADTLETGVARSVREEYSSWGAGAANALDFFPPLVGLVDSGREDGGRVLLVTT